MATLMTSQRHRPTDRYMALVRRFPLRPIRTKKDYDAACQAIEPLVVQENPTPDDADYLNVLQELIDHYEDQLPEPFAFGSSTEKLEALREESGLSRAAFGRILTGVKKADSTSSSLAAKVLSGQRELSKAHIRRLCDYFKMDPGYFL